ncbi:hypothetical protein KUCAC02_024467, partial [Chaenocephalus aceratus]
AMHWGSAGTSEWEEPKSRSLNGHKAVWASQNPEAIREGRTGAIGSSSDNDVSDSPSRSAGLSPEHHLQSIVWVKQAQVNALGYMRTHHTMREREGMFSELPTELPQSRPPSGTVQTPALKTLTPGTHRLRKVADALLCMVCMRALVCVNSY